MKNLLCVILLWCNTHSRCESVCWCSSSTSIQYLTEVCGVSTHTRDHRLQTSLFKACSQGNIEMLNYLLRKDVGFTQSRARLISLDCDCMFQSNIKNVHGVSGVVASKY